MIWGFHYDALECGFLIICSGMWVRKFNVLIHKMCKEGKSKEAQLVLKIVAMLATVTLFFSYLFV